MHTKKKYRNIELNAVGKQGFPPNFIKPQNVTERLARLHILFGKTIIKILTKYDQTTDRPTDGQTAVAKHLQFETKNLFIIFMLRHDMPLTSLIRQRARTDRQQNLVKPNAHNHNLRMHVGPMYAKGKIHLAVNKMLQIYCNFRTEGSIHRDTHTCGCMSASVLLFVV